MRISREQLLHETANPRPGRTPLAVIGMPGIGKTRWSKALAQHLGYELAEVDAGIAKILDVRVTRDSPKAMGEWLGHPWQVGYPEREQQYLAAERATMQRIMYRNNCLIDTAGSAVYIPDIMAEIRKRALVIYLQAEGREHELRKKHRTNPRAICWNGQFTPETWENNVEAYFRLFPVLMETRAKLYDQFADVRINSSAFETARRKPSVQGLITAIAKELPTLRNEPPRER